MKLRTRERARKYLVGISLFFLSVTIVSLVIDLRSIRTQYEKLALVESRAIFQTIVAMRNWNFKHDGVYVLVSKTLKPNPYLKDPRRDLVTTEGLKLTKVNAAYMTRLLSDQMRRNNNVHIHITSLKLLNPGNRADLWERDALARFESGSRDEHEIVRTGKGPIFRYMAPLMVERSCLACHGDQGYRVGDVRGGISVTFSYTPFGRAMRGAFRRITLVHVLFLFLGLGIIFLLGRKIIRRIEELQDTMDRIKKLEGLLPICSGCKKIRLAESEEMDRKSWVPIEEYIGQRTDAEFSHGLCPDCLKKLYPDYRPEGEAGGPVRSE
ncbi:MAG: DUF3365 domain-containing protein [Deltaproteobacteria bacterium]|nr:DUF3365 domain-containing protein [Deltaproteobacteria bacterium]